jgi:hypothetical protein
MTGITEEQLDKIKKICQEIGCSGVDPEMCQNHPEYCNIIKKIVWKVVRGNSDTYGTFR